MLLSEILAGIAVKGVYDSHGREDVEILSNLHTTGLSTDSRKIMPGDVFLCIRGEHTDGHEFAAEAVSRGAVAVVAERFLPTSVPQIIVRSSRRAAAFMWNNRYLRPAEGMRIIAVTGTNGKTSVSCMIKSILDAAGFRCGLVGTVECLAGDRVLSFGGGSEISDAAAAMTTPDPEFLYGMLREMKLCGVTHVVMEASSHALAQEKLSPLTADVAVFTGLSPEHLDYHGTMENYLSAKSVLFRQARCGIINFDDPYGAQLCRIATAPCTLVGTDPDVCRITGDSPVSGIDGVEYVLRTEAGEVKIACAMPGRFGFYNSLLAASAALKIGVSLNTIRQGLADFRAVPGRMETVARWGRCSAIVDYAHTPEALRGAVSIAAEGRQGRLWLLFGCGGDRDRTKRPEMGRIASEMADFTIITSDNPRSEDRDVIIADIMGGFDKTRPYAVIPDRGDAIRYAVENMADGDTLLLCGKGHEKYEITSAGKQPFDEVRILRDAVENLRK